MRIVDDILSIKSNIIILTDEARWSTLRFDHNKLQAEFYFLLIEFKLFFANNIKSKLDAYGARPAVRLFPFGVPDALLRNED